MRARVRLTLLVALAIGIAGTVRPAIAQDAGKPVRLRVLSYNIHHGEGVDRVLDLERIAKVIRSVEPDLVALQEVDKDVQRSKQVDQPAELAKLTGLKAVFGRNIPLQGGEYGNAVLSKFPIRRHENHALPSFDKGEQRGVLEVSVEVAGLDAPVTFLATHLDHRADGRERLASAKAINEIVSKKDGPAVLAGDLNDRPESQTLAELKTAWTSASTRPMPTIPVANPARQIDFILYRPATRWKVVEVQVLDEAVASDHRAIFAVLELNTGG
jgi:endonuclease/exonuclease/phosphatase family metal-dependent hydrolase